MERRGALRKLAITRRYLLIKSIEYLKHTDGYQNCTFILRLYHRGVQRIWSSGDHTASGTLVVDLKLARLIRKALKTLVVGKQAAGRMRLIVRQSEAPALDLAADLEIKPVPVD